MAPRSARVPAAVVLILAAVAACGGRSGSPAAVAAPSQAAATRAVDASSPVPPTVSGPVDDLLPNEIAGVTLTKRTIHGPDIADLDAAEAANFGAILQNVDGPPEAFAVTSATGDGLAVSAWRMEGTEGGQLGDSFIAFVSGQGESEVEDITIEGKAVKRITPADTAPLHVYVVDEVMFVVQSTNPELVPEVFAVLP
jgi:hypothetical protein